LQCQGADRASSAIRMVLARDDSAALANPAKGPRKLKYSVAGLLAPRSAPLDELHRLFEIVRDVEPEDSCTAAHRASSTLLRNCSIRTTVPKLRNTRALSTSVALTFFDLDRCAYMFRDESGPVAPGCAATERIRRADDSQESCCRATGSSLVVLGSRWHKCRANDTAVTPTSFVVATISPLHLVLV